MRLYVMNYNCVALTEVAPVERSPNLMRNSGEWLITANTLAWRLASYEVHIAEEELPDETIFYLA